MASEFDIPNSTQVVDESRRVTLAWLQVFSRWQRVILAAQQSGPAASRPTSLLWVGRRYMATDLGADAAGMPIYVAQVKPTVVWVDAAGSVVA